MSAVVETVAPARVVANAVTGRRDRRIRRSRRAGLYVLVYGAGLLFVVFSVFPIAWGLSTALKPSQF
jgi:hypothetical protein